GTATNPQVDAEIFSDRLSYDNATAYNISTKFHYFGDMIYLSDTSAEIFGGYVKGTAEIRTDDFSFSANVKANNLNAVELCAFTGSEQNISGKISADIGINGVGADPDKLKIYGNARASNVDFENLIIDEANGSFYWRDETLTLDYLSVNLPNRGTLGLEGTISEMSKLDLQFYGAHVDMTMMKNFNDALDMSGLADFRGTVNGEADNPNITIELSAVDNSKREGNHFVGKFFKQPFDSIQLVASGNLSGVNINKFDLEKDGKLKWTVIEGNVGLTGERVINLQLQTTEARAEDIAALVAPDQEITGNVTNSVKITGTLDNPKVVGNIKFNRGSYRGMLLSGMTGDYFLEGDALRLQNFEITSPMIDLILNGTINKNTQVMDFVVEAKDINLQRFKAKLPENYTASGHTTFEGIIKGTPAYPIFDGELKSNEIFLNGVALSNVYGHVAVNGSNVYLEDFRFNEGEGIYQLQVSTNLDSQMISGEVEVLNANIANLLTMANQKTDLIEGTLDSKILLGGTISKPTGSMTGQILSGTFAGYDIHDIKLSASLNNNVLYINQLQGKQGEKGTINLIGSANLNGGELSATLTAREIALGLFSKAAGYNIEMVGTSNIDATLGGTFDNPTGEVTLTATGGIKGSTFDLLRGHFVLRDKRVNVEELIVQRELGGKIYGARASGFIPWAAVIAQSKETLPTNEQLDLTVSLDDADLSMLPLLSKQIAWGIGDLNGSVKITGTAARPQVNGKISLNDGSVKVKGMKSLIEHINITTIFSGERFDIKNFTANIGTGTFTVTGGFSFPNLELTNYNFDIVSDKLDIKSDVYKGLLNAKFNISEGTFFHWHLPKITGQVDFDHCRLSIPDIPESDDPLPNILLDISVNAGEKVHFYKSRLYDMYLTGNARFEGTTLHPKTSGIINVKRGGTLTYLESVFNIREGELHFNQVDTFMPTLHFLAETKIDRTRITLLIDGPPNNFKLKLSSSPEMSDTEILRLLTLREAYSRGEGSLSTSDALAIGLQMTILSELEDALKQSLGIDMLRVTRGKGSLFDHRNAEERKNDDHVNDYNVTIGKYVNDRLMLRYTRGFGSHKLNRYGLQYEFNDNIGITIEREGKDYIFSVEARYKF
ncbi:MAG: translocation/assembly module TamB domain-containing protein, partial [Selenomonadaceae bacterium]|nr:translocation/assembly module TamB domain-containing protein [Selenomonadaceae bacterium]